jgi:hypothetical protein
MTVLDAKQSDLFIKTTKEITLYVGRTYTYGGDIKIAVESLAMPTLKVPTDPAAEATKTEELIWKKKVEEYVHRETYFEENVKILFSLVWGQCTDIMRQKVEALDAFENLSAKNDEIELLKTIENTPFLFETQKNAWQASHEAICHFSWFRRASTCQPKITLSISRTRLKLLNTPVVSLGSCRVLRTNCLS